MLYERYDVNASTDLTSFEFESKGPKGDIQKVVRYTEINIKGYYNLGFGDKDPYTGLISDLTVTNNNDSKKVLATVAATLFVFTDNYPGATIIATGSTVARTRLYRIGISNNLAQIENNFSIFGLGNDGWESFRINVNYTAFLVRRKS